MRICVLHRPYRNTEWQTKFTGQEFADDAIEEARHHAAAIAANGHDTEIFTWSQDIRENIDRLRDGGYDLVVNASSLEEVALLSLLNIRFMGSGLNLVSLDKAARKRFWFQSGVTTPRYALIEEMEDLEKAQLPEYPLFVKPVRGRGSAGITDESIVNNYDELERACRRIIENMEQGALVEEYISGAEITVGVIGNGDDLTVLTPLEIEYSGEARTNSFLHKQDNEIIHCPPRLPAEAIEQLKQAAKQAFISLEARDFGRIDFIYDTQRKKPYALELNTFAGLQILSGQEENLHASYIGNMAEHLGWDSRQVFGLLLTSAFKRYGLIDKAEAKPVIAN